MLFHAFACVCIPRLAVAYCCLPVLFAHLEKEERTKEKKEEANKNGHYVSWDVSVEYDSA